MPPGFRTPIIARVQDPINGHRLTFAEARDFPHAIVWRAISSERRYGHWEYLFDDLVLEMNLGLYLRVVSSRGVERLSLHRMGEVEETLERYKDGGFRPMKGAGSLASEKKLAKLDDPTTYGRHAARQMRETKKKKEATDG
jgi:hypothetical protein